MIDDNESLFELDGLANLSHVGSYLNIRDNSLLERYCGLHRLLTTEGGLTGSYRVLNNGSNPTKEEVIAGGPCEVPLRLPVMEIERDGPGIRISWDSDNGVIYELQVSNGLSPISVWEPLLVVEGTGDRLSFEHENPLPGAGFYRLDLENPE